jgi:hypothetical protein
MRSIDEYFFDLALIEPPELYNFIGLPLLRRTEQLVDVKSPGGAPIIRFVGSYNNEWIIFDGTRYLPNNMEGYTCYLAPKMFLKDSELCACYTT